MNDQNKFRDYLQKKGFSLSTIRQHINYSEMFLEWMEQERLRVDQVRYNDLVVFISQLKEKNFSTNYINRVLLSIRHYYNYLAGESREISNPAANFYLKGSLRRIIHDVVSYPDLERIYLNYRVKDKRDRRNKVILGVLIYQGVTTEELHRLEMGHVDLQEGTLYVPGGPRKKQPEAGPAECPGDGHGAVHQKDPAAPGKDVRANRPAFYQYGGIPEP